ncbi:MAG: glycosyltransferase family 4 protein [Aquaticitalea sp.]
MDGRKIKILYTIPNFNTAGSGKVVYDLAKGLNKERFEVSFACFYKKGSFFKEVEALGFPIYLIRSTVPLRPYHNIFARLNTFKNFVKTHQFDIVHSWHWSSDWTEALAVRSSGVKWLYTKKAMGFDNKHWKIRSFMASFIVTINDEMRNYFPNKKQQRLIPLGIDTNYYNPNIFTSKEKPREDEFNIVTIANLVPIKGIEILIRAVHLLKDKSVKLSILGDHNSDYGYELITLCEQLNLNDKVSFLGKQMDIRPYLANSDLYVIPTLDKGRKEGMPMALVEAMAMGIPVLGSDISGINYVLKDFPQLLFTASDIHQLASKIEKLCHTPSQERELIGNSLRTYCEQHFSLGVFIEAHEQLYSELIN